MQRLAMLCIGLVLALSSGFYADSAFSLTDSAKRANSLDDTEFQKGQAVLTKHGGVLMNIPGVVGVGIGTTAEGAQVALHVYVNVEATGGTIPSAIPPQLDGVPVKVIRTDEIKAR